ncbi:MAG: putative penicillin-binding protein [Parcubacteria group bacterium]|nr:putative penicillin-binding protein [Parcubacteria group bacterium]
MRKKRHLKFWKKFIKNAVIIATALVLFAVSALIYWVSTFQIPDLGSFEKRKVIQSTKIYDRTGKILLYDLHQDIKRTVVPIEEISRNIKNAAVAIEDEEFYQHKGIKITSIIRALLANLVKGGYSQGGSTITQQVVKNSLLNSEKKISRKLKEWFLALKLEKMMSKDEILGIYLNEAPYGGNIYGIEEASQAYFGKNASDLTIAESAHLASLPNAPSYYSPYGQNVKKLLDRKNLVLKRMLDKNFISKDEYDSAMKEVVSFYPQDRLGIKAPHFVTYTIKYLENKYGAKAVEEGGLKVTTTLNYELQHKAEGIVKKYSLENKQKFNAENAAVAVVDPKTGQILVMVGSRDYFDKEINGNFNVATAHRQPGSAFKPFVYAAAFNKGFTPDTVLFDLPTQFQANCDPKGAPIPPSNKIEDCYMPNNYDNLFVGPITLRNALAQSRNIPSVKLLYLTGIKDSLRLAKDMGIEELGGTNQYGLSLVLGGGEVSLLDITSAYGVFANNGVKNPTTGIIEVVDKEGKTLEKYELKSSAVLPEDTALKISDILSDNTARIPLYGNRSLLYFENRDVAVKTGTTNDYRDAWTVGYTPNATVGAWVGNNDNSSMEKKVSGLIVTPMWRAVMDEVLSIMPKEKFRKATNSSKKDSKPVFRGIWKGGESYFVDKISGKLASTSTPKELLEEKVITNVHSILYWIDKSDTLNPNKPQNPESDPQFKNWEYSVQEWLKSQNLPKDPAKPIEFDDVHTEKNKPKIKITEPATDKEYNKDERVVVKITSSGNYPLLKAEYSLNGEYIGSSNKAPFDFVLPLEEISNIKKENDLRAVIYDTVLNKNQDAVIFKIKL